MKIEVFAICYNEELLLPYFLRHYSSFCDEITIFDNQSTDSGPALCRANPKVNLISYDTSNEIRDDIYLEIKNNCWKKSDADWVIICDMDEFVYHPDIKTILTHMGEVTAISPEWFNMYSRRFPETEGQIYEEVSLGTPGGPKLNLFRPGELKEINYSPGCHIAQPEGNVLVSQWTGIKTLHFRYLSKEFVLSRNAVSFARLSQQNKENGWGFHYGFDPSAVAEDFDIQLALSTKVI
jgi:glycosyltransferase involved in cell wall biosynthesis